MSSVSTRPNPPSEPQPTLDTSVIRLLKDLLDDTILSVENISLASWRTPDPGAIVTEFKRIRQLRSGVRDEAKPVLVLRQRLTPRLGNKRIVDGNDVGRDAGLGLDVAGNVAVGATRGECYVRTVN